MSHSQQSYAEQWVTFHSAPVDLEDSDVIRGIVSKPQGNGPFPAVVIAHGCFGVETNHTTWAQRLNDWGYATIIVDSFTTRNKSNICSNPESISPRTRAFDIYGAVAYLRKQSFVNPKLIGMIGFSHGGWTALYVGQRYISKKAKEEPLQAVVSYYPWCQKRNLRTTSIPLLILAGKLDEWTPVERCYQYIKAQKEEYGKNIVIKDYDNSYHGFDDSSLKEPITYDGYMLQYNANSAKSSISETQIFLARYLQ